MSPPAPSPPLPPSLHPSSSPTPSPAGPSTPPTTCPVCLDKLPSNPFRPPCNHHLCPPCLHRHLIILFRTPTTPLTCPLCPTPLPPPLLLSHTQTTPLSAPLQTHLAGLLQQNVHHCSNNRCNTPFDFIDPGPQTTNRFLITCPLCNSDTCVACNAPFHQGTCPPGPLRQLAERNRWQKCPRCGHMVEKTAGCRHVRCRCGANFCYECGGVAFPLGGERRCQCHEGEFGIAMAHLAEARYAQRRRRMQLRDVEPGEGRRARIERAFELMNGGFDAFRGTPGDRLELPVRPYRRFGEGFGGRNGVNEAGGGAGVNVENNRLANRRDGDAEMTQLARTLSRQVDTLMDAVLEMRDAPQAVFRALGRVDDTTQRIARRFPPDEDGIEVTGRALARDMAERYPSQLVRLRTAGPMNSTGAGYGAGAPGLSRLADAVHTALSTGPPIGDVGSGRGQVPQEENSDRASRRELAQAMAMARRANAAMVTASARFAARMRRSRRDGVLGGLRSRLPPAERQRYESGELRWADLRIGRNGYFDVMSWVRGRTPPLSENATRDLELGVCPYCKAVYDAELGEHLVTGAAHEVWLCCGRLFESRREWEDHTGAVHNMIERGGVVEVVDSQGSEI